MMVFAYFKYTKRKRTLITSGLLLALLVGWIVFHSVDSPPFDDSGFLSRLKKVSPENNGYELLAYLNHSESTLFPRQMVDRIKAHINHKEWDQVFVDKALSTHQPLFIDVERSLELPYFAFPVSKKIDDFPYYSHFFNVSLLMNLQSRNAFRAQRYDDAVRSIERLLHFSQRIKAEENASLVIYFIGMAMQNRALDLAHEMASSQLLDAGQLQHLAVAINSLPKHGEDGFNKVFVGEYVFVMNWYVEGYENFSDRFQLLKMTVESFFDGNAYPIKTGLGDIAYQFFYMLIPSYYFHPNEFRVKIVPYYTQVQSHTSDYCNALALPIAAFGDVTGLGWSAILMPNSRTRYDMHLLPDWSVYFHRACLFHTYKEAVLAVIAMHLYKMDKGVMPNALNQLVPNYMSVLPKDYFTGGPLKFYANKQWLYSVGLDGNDEEGSAGMVVTKGRCKIEDKCYDEPTFPVNYAY